MRMLTAGTGEPLVLLHAFGLSPHTYTRTIDQLSTDARVLAPWWGRLGGRWSFEQATRSLELTLDANEVDKAVVVGHSFGGALAVALAATQPERLRALVVVDSLVLHPGKRQLMRLGLQARHLRNYLSLPAARDFVSFAAMRPRDLAAMARWAFMDCNLQDAVDAVRVAGIPRAVMWGADDSLLPAELGSTLASALDAPFLAASRNGAGPIEHDWAYRHPQRFVEELRAALASAGIKV